MYLQLMRRLEPDHPRLELLRQHQPITVAMERVMAWFDDPRSHIALSAALDRLAELLQDHFACQEEDWGSALTRRQEEHRDDHRHLLDDLANLQREVAERPERGRLLSRLRSFDYWLMTHLEDEELQRV